MAAAIAEELTRMKHVVLKLKLSWSWNTHTHTQVTRFLITINIIEELAEIWHPLLQWAMAGTYFLLQGKAEYEVNNGKGTNTHLTNCLGKSIRGTNSRNA